MKAVAWVEFRNKRKIVTLVGAPPKGFPPFDVIALRFQNRPRLSRGDTTIYMAPDEAAYVVAFVGKALQVVSSPLRQRVARDRRWKRRAR